MPPTDEATEPQPKKEGKVAVILLVLLLLAGIGSLLPDKEEDPAPPPRFGSDEYCIERADELMEQYPETYHSRQQAYDGCRSAGEVVDELKGDVDRRP